MNRPPFPEPTTVTAKVNMNQPFSVMRRPNRGEVAISMTGSPVMLSSDDKPTLSVPLANGNVSQILMFCKKKKRVFLTVCNRIQVLSVLPKIGCPMDVSFDDQTKNDLNIIKENIEMLLKKYKK